MQTMVWNSSQRYTEQVFGRGAANDTGPVTGHFILVPRVHSALHLIMHFSVPEQAAPHGKDYRDLSFFLTSSLHELHSY
jgi:hypothetical protein